MNKLINPIQGLFANIQKIINFIEIKDLKLANEKETDESRDNAEVWMAAIEGNDNYLTYRRWWNIGLFQAIRSNVRWVDYEESVS